MRVSKKISREHRGKKKINIYLVSAVAIVLVMAFLFVQYIVPYLERPPPYRPPINVTEPPVNKTLTEIISENIEECVSSNPALTQEQCWDVKYHETAIGENNITLCDNIKSEDVRDHCRRYFI
jgi:hypothetical protein